MRIGDELPLRKGLLLGKSKAILRDGEAIKKAACRALEFQFQFQFQPTTICWDVRYVSNGTNLEGGTIIVACERPKSTGIGSGAIAYSMPFINK